MFLFHIHCTLNQHTLLKVFLKMIIYHGLLDMLTVNYFLYYSLQIESVKNTPIHRSIQLTDNTNWRHSNRYYVTMAITISRPNEKSRNHWINHTPLQRNQIKKKRNTIAFYGQNQQNVKKTSKPFPCIRTVPQLETLTRT